MKQVISINLQGRVIPIEQTAFDLLKMYTEKLRAYFSGEEGCEEIINDIENRIVELFQKRLHSGAACITEADVEAVIKSIGQPEDFDEWGEGNGKSEPISGETEPGGPRRLFRDENHRVLGGVCRGLANYFDIDVVIVRIVFILLIGVLFLPYIILWIVVPGTTMAKIGSQRKKLYRDGDKNIIGGVCSGLGFYLNINPWIPRILFLLSFFSYSWDLTPFHSPFMQLGLDTTVVFLYIILWIILPKAKTASEKLEMRGEKVDIQTISHTVKEEMKGAAQRISSTATDLSQTAGERGREIATEIKGTVQRTRGPLGDIFRGILRLLGEFLKIIGYFIIGILFFALFSSILGLGLGAFAIFPLKDFIIGTPLQEFLTWSTLLLLFIPPIIITVIWFIRRRPGKDGQSRRLRPSLLFLWIFGWLSMLSLSVLSLLISAGNEFSHRYTTPETTIPMERSDFESLTIWSSTKNLSFDFSEEDVNLTPAALYNMDTFHINILRIHILKSPADSFMVKMKKMSYGSSTPLAEKSANMITPVFELIDSSLTMDPGINISRVNKFRNQAVILHVYVPVGKKITLNTGKGFNGIYFVMPDILPFYDIDWNEGPLGVPESGRTYIMKEDGLYTPDGMKVDIKSPE